MPTFNSGFVQSGDIPCKGNGMTLGITNGSTNYGMYMTGGQTQLATGMTGSYGANVGTGGSGTRYTSANSFDVTLDKTKSGIIADTTSLILVCNMIIKI